MIDLLDGRVHLHIGDCIKVLETMEPDSVDCIVTSPPYWGLRDYGVEGQIGLEPTLAEHLAVMVRVFEAVKRVLKPTGTCWVNYGDCYATTPNGRSAADTKATGNDDRTFRDKPFSTIQGVLKAKDLCMVPNRFAIALQESGWWVRSEIIWAKPNPMPESIRDRPATSHEKIFMLTKSPRYFYDAKAVRQAAAGSSLQRWSQDIDSQEGSHRANGGAKTNGTMKAVGGPRMNENANGFRGGSYVGGKPGKRTETGNVPGTGDRNLRNYEPAPLEAWNIATQPFSEAHFATFPPELAERCILAGCPKGGLVLDPFGGAGTTALVALRHGRKASLIELNPEYADITQRRIEKEWRVQPKRKSNDHGPLFAENAA
ncbi:DNA modification methylase [Phyllobacterium ifriqiyense]|uniref:Methyltransferase n=1 Tax=Phyllobacterium ifriqiyense TaxID=314238 RepID=A0ABU0S830_9HYPH|nr:site-specific DNA-methyltransferase [Phyllobacterium ifriqiyense]MDQ0996903.1 DNA modification methylase [Phyllobacterium ifriqiyense]